MLRRLRVEHGPLMFHQSGGCCDGSSPMCFPAGEFITGDADVLLPYRLGVGVFATSGATLLSAAFVRSLWQANLPPLSLSYSLTFGAMLTLFPLWAARSSLADQLTWPYPIGALGWIDSFLRSMGMIVFSPQPATGLLIAAALLLWSRAAFLAGLVGWVAGVATAMLIERLGVTGLWLLSAHSYFLGGMMLGAAFFLPGRAALVAAAAAGACASLLSFVIQHALSGTGWAFMPLPALLTVWISLAALSRREENHPLVNNGRRDLPPGAQAGPIRRRCAAVDGAGRRPAENRPGFRRRAQPPRSMAARSRLRTSARVRRRQPDFGNAGPRPSCRRRRAGHRRRRRQSAWRHELRSELGQPRRHSHGPGRLCGAGPSAPRKRDGCAREPRGDRRSSRQDREFRPFAGAASALAGATNPRAGRADGPFPPRQLPRRGRRAALPVACVRGPAPRRPVAPSPRSPTSPVGLCAAPMAC